MTNAELLAKIKAEIERLRAENESIKCASNGAYCTGYDDAFYDLFPFLSTLESERQKQKEVLPERSTLIDADCLISKLDNLHGKYEKKFNKTGYPGFESAMALIDEIQGMILQMKSKVRKK